MHAIGDIGREDVVTHCGDGHEEMHWFVTVGAYRQPRDQPLQFVEVLARTVGVADSKDDARDFLPKHLSE